MDDAGGEMMRHRRGTGLLELSVALMVTALILGLVVPFTLRVQRQTGAMAAQARAVAGAREVAAQLRRDVQGAARARVAGAALLLELPAERNGYDRVTYARERGGWVRRCRRATGREEAPLWLREEVRAVSFAREGRAVRAVVECAPTEGRARPVTLEVYAAPRNGGP
jgi:type II secretory pathway component PulJ